MAAFWFLREGCCERHAALETCADFLGCGLDSKSLERKLEIRVFGEPNSQFAPRAGLLLFFSITFLVRMAQDFERFEQGRLQRAVLPGRPFHYSLEQPPLL